MVKLHTWKCTICKEEVKEIGSYVKLGLTKYAHLDCVRDAAYNAGVDDGRGQVLQEQAKEKQEREERERKQAELEAERLEARMAEAYSSLPRCRGCGRKVNVVRKYITNYKLEDLRKLGEVQEPSTGVLAQVDTCSSCVEIERIARNEARKSGALAPEPPKEAPKSEEKKDRFELLDID